MRRKLIVSVILAIFLASCSGIKPLRPELRTDIYSESFLQLIALIKDKYAQGKTYHALRDLRAIEDEKIKPSERALKYNLLGVIAFDTKKYEKAIKHFQTALQTSEPDQALTAQIYLNIASTYYKMSIFEKAFAHIKECDFKMLNEKEGQKYHFLNYILASQLEKSGDAVRSLVRLLGKHKTLPDLRQSKYFDKLTYEFSKMTKSQRLMFLEELEAESLLSVAYIGYLEAERLYYTGDKSEASDILDWIESKFDEYPEMVKLVSDFKFRLENFAKINTNAIGVILPFSGRKAKFANRAMRGLDSAMQKSYRKTAEGVVPPTLYVKDSKGSGAVGAKAVRELVEKHFVSVIIGGMFSDEARKEYLEAKKHGVMFISLSQVYLPRERKDHLLVEIPGSVESQISILFSKKLVEKFGKRGAIIYPDSDRGEAFIGEFWRQAKNRGVEVVGVQKYQKNKTDHRESVKKLLGLKFKRERQEELDLWSQIYSLQKRRSGARRIQTLSPVIEFDWVYIPTFPNEALQILPAFNYFDAFNVKFFGTPSWRSQSLAKKARRYGKLHFIGDPIKSNRNSFVSYFQSSYGYRPKLIESVSFDAMKVVADVLKGANFSSRDDLAHQIQSKSDFQGVTGRWALEDGLWLKNMAPLALRRGKIEKIWEGQKSSEIVPETLPSSSDQKVPEKKQAQLDKVAEPKTL